MLEYEYDESILNMIDKRFQLLNSNRDKMTQEYYQNEVSKLIMLNRKVHKDELNPLKVQISKDFFILNQFLKLF